MASHRALIPDLDRCFRGSAILRQITVGRRNRAFEAPEVIEVFTALERQLASPGGDARISGPSRRVPRQGGGCVP